MSGFNKYSTDLLRDALDASLDIQGGYSIIHPKREGETFSEMVFSLAENHPKIKHLFRNKHYHIHSPEYDFAKGYDKYLFEKALANIFGFFNQSALRDFIRQNPNCWGKGFDKDIFENIEAFGEKFIDPNVLYDKLEHLSYSQEDWEEETTLSDTQVRIKKIIYSQHEPVGFVHDKNIFQSQSYEIDSHQNKTLEAFSVFLNLKLVNLFEDVESPQIVEQEVFGNRSVLIKNDNIYDCYGCKGHIFEDLIVFFEEEDYRNLRWLEYKLEKNILNLGFFKRLALQDLDQE